jgi:hypothetical protein
MNVGHRVVARSIVLHSKDQSTFTLGNLYLKLAASAAREGLRSKSMSILFVTYLCLFVLDAIGALTYTLLVVERVGKYWSE